MGGDDELSRVKRELWNLERSHAALEASVDRMGETLDSTIAELEEFRTAFRDSQRRAELMHNSETAQIKLVLLRQDIERRFGYRNEIRNMANGILEAMDAECVTNESIQALTEEKMLTAPGYWLAPTLLGLAAWIRDDWILADRAMRTALVRDVEKASLFYGLILVRLGRHRAAADWLQQAITRHGLRDLPREFAVVLDAAVCRVLGRHAQRFAVEHMNSWFEELADDFMNQQQQIAQWQEFVVSIKRETPDHFVALREICPNWEDELLPAYELSAALAATREFIYGIHERQGSSPLSLKLQIRDILRTLVHKFDDDELQYDQEDRMLRSIIGAGGDVDAAESFLAATPADDGGTVDFLTLITRTATTARPDDYGEVSAGTQWITILLSRRWIQPAIRALAEEGERRLRNSIEISVAGWMGRVSDDISPEQLIDSARKVVSAEIADRVARIHFGVKGIALTAVAGLGLIAGAFGALAGTLGTSSLFIGIIGLLCAVGALYRFGRLAPSRKALHREEKKRTEELQKKIPSAFREFRLWRDECALGISSAGEICSFLGTFPDVKLQGDSRLEPGGEPSFEIEFDFASPPVESTTQPPTEDSSGKRLAIRLPSWNLLPPPQTPTSTGSHQEAR